MRANAASFLQGNLGQALRQQNTQMQWLFKADSLECHVCEQENYNIGVEGARALGGLLSSSSSLKVSPTTPKPQAHL